MNIENREIEIEIEDPNAIAIAIAIVNCNCNCGFDCDCDCDCHCDCDCDCDCNLQFAIRNSQLRTGNAANWNVNAEQRKCKCRRLISADCSGLADGNYGNILYGEWTNGECEWRMVNEWVNGEWKPPQPRVLSECRMHGPCNIQQLLF